MCNKRHRALNVFVRLITLLYTKYRVLNLTTSVSIAYCLLSNMYHLLAELLLSFVWRTTKLFDIAVILKSTFGFLLYFQRLDTAGLIYKKNFTKMGDRLQNYFLFFCSTQQILFCSTRL